MSFSISVERLIARPENFLEAVSTLDTPAVRAVLRRYLIPRITASKLWGLPVCWSETTPTQSFNSPRSGRRSDQCPRGRGSFFLFRTRFGTRAPRWCDNLRDWCRQAQRIEDSRDRCLSCYSFPRGIAGSGLSLGECGPAERMKGVFGISSFANGCLSQTPDNVASLAYIVLPASAPYQTAETIANFGFRRGPDDEEARLVSFWSSWLERALGTSLRFSVVPFAASRGLARCPVRPAVPDLPHDVSAQPVACLAVSTPELHSLGSKMPHPAPNLSPSLGRSI